MEAGARQGGAVFALSGNLRMLGIPVWIGQLPREVSAVRVVVHIPQGHLRVDAFLSYLKSSEGQRVISNFGFQSEPSP